MANGYLVHGQYMVNRWFVMASCDLLLLGFAEGRNKTCSPSIPMVSGREGLTSSN